MIAMDGIALTIFTITANTVSLIAATSALAKYIDRKLEEKITRIVENKLVEHEKRYHFS